MSRKTVKIKFTGFDPASFRPEDHWVTKTLRKRYDVILSDDPDFLFYSVWGDPLDFWNYDCVRVFCAGEAVSPNFNECDYAFGFEPIIYNDRYMPYPVGDVNSPGIYDLDRSVMDRSDAEPEMFDRKFCNFIYSQDWMGMGAFLRKDFCLKLMEYKHVDCPGHVLNNMPKGAIASRWTGGANGQGTITRTWSDDKLDFLRKYKFTIAFENSPLSGVTTEKLMHPVLAYSVPIYWGNPDVDKLFNPKAFINCMDYDGDFDAVIERIKELDTDRDKYLEMLSQPPLQPDFDFDRKKKAEEFLFRIIERGNKPFAKDTIHISSYYRVKAQLDDALTELDKTKQALQQYGIAYDSDSWEFMCKLRRFADSKWGYLPKKAAGALVRLGKSKNGSAVPALSDTRRIDFSKDGNCMEFLADGWYGQEQDSRWSCARASLRIVVNDGKTRTMKIRYKTHPGAKDTAVMYNGSRVGLLPHHWADDYGIAAITLPGICTNKNGFQVITFETDGAMTSKEYYGGDVTDTRVLGVMVSLIELTD